MGKTVVITGGAAGIGRAVAQRCLQQDWDVCLVDRDEQQLEQAAADLGCRSQAADVTDPEQLAAAYARAAEATGSIDGLVNSAGINRPAPSSELSEEDWRSVIEIDLSGTFYSCQAAFPHLSRGAGIVNLASVLAARATPGRAAYTAAKIGVLGVTRVLAVEWAQHGIRVNAIGPAWTDTPMLRGLIDSGAVSESELIGRIPMGRLCSLADILPAVCFLLSERDAGFITGQTIYIDGGYTWAG